MPQYVVQVKIDADEESDARWDDIAVINAEPKTRRSAVIGEAFREAGMEGQAGTFVVRVLDEDSADASTVSYAQVQPKLEIR